MILGLTEIQASSGQQTSFDKAILKWGWVWNLFCKHNFSGKTLEQEFTALTDIFEQRIQGDASPDDRTQERLLLTCSHKRLKSRKIDEATRQVYLRVLAFLFKSNVFDNNPMGPELTFDCFPVKINEKDFEELIPYLPELEVNSLIVEEVENWKGLTTKSLGVFLSKYGKSLFIQEKPFTRLADLTIQTSGKTVKLNTALLERVFQFRPLFAKQTSQEENGKLTLHLEDPDEFASFWWLGFYSIQRELTHFGGFALSLHQMKTFYEFYKKWKIYPLVDDLKRSISSRISESKWEEFELATSQQDWILDFAQEIRRKIELENKNKKSVKTLKEIVSLNIFKKKLALRDE